MSAIEDLANQIHGSKTKLVINGEPPFQNGSTFAAEDKNVNTHILKGLDECILNLPPGFEFDQTKLGKITPMPDLVNHPPHYKAHPSGVECIQISEHFGFCLGNAIKYIWRAAEKGEQIKDLKKARWYLDREIQRLEKK
jgi:hypothetical protein